MSVDPNDFRDRLYADVLASSIRVPTGFVEAQTEVALSDIESYVWLRAREYRKELSATEAEVDSACRSELSSWQTQGPGEERRRIVAFLARAAVTLLQTDGREMILRVDRAEPGREILRWRFVSLALPPVILIAAATPSGFVVPEAVRLLGSSIAPDHPVSHQHVHHAAMLSFEELWASLRLRALLHPGELSSSLRDPRAFCPGLHSGLCFAGRSVPEQQLAKKYPFARAKHLMEWGAVIRLAFIARRVLDRHTSHRGSLANCSDGDCTNVAVTTLRDFLVGRTRTYCETAVPYPWPDELVGLARRARPTKSKTGRQSGNSGSFDLIHLQTAEERGLLGRAFAHLCSESQSRDPLYERLFVQYLRVKTAVFRMLVHSPGERGLLKFLEHFQQIKVYAPESDSIRPRSPNEPGLRVLSTEYRVAPDAWFEILQRHDREIEDSEKHEIRSEAAWLIHFKRRGDDKLLPLFGSTVRTMESEADQIVRALTARPERLSALRGIDVCGVEEMQPGWVSAETLRRVRIRSRRIAGGRPSLSLEPLRLTLHVGEDFAWLTSGMRAIAEPFHWNLIERGDRIGHGIAVTLSPEVWWQRKNAEVVAVHTFDRLMDLAFLAEYAGGRTGEQDEWLRLEIERISRALGFDRGSCHPSGNDTVETAREVWRYLGRAVTRRLMEIPNWRADSGPRYQRWIHSYLWNRSTQERAEAEIQITVGDDLNERDLLIKARKHLIREIARWQVCIESNPSSNLIVGGLDAMVAQDFLQQRPTQAGALGEETLTWTISTDDPITFSTTLADEYAYAWAGMVLRTEKPYDPSYARALLDEAAATSMRLRFTPPRQDRKVTRQQNRWRVGRAPGH